MKPYKEGFIRFLKDTGALKFGSFETKSGRNSPYFINTGRFFTGSLLSKLTQFYCDHILDNIAQFDCIFGPAYKGIPLAVSCAIQLSNEEREIGYSFDRKEVKDHGDGGLLVGYPLADFTKVILVDDVITSGISIKHSYEVLKQQRNPQIVGLIVAVDRMEKSVDGNNAVKDLKDLGIQVFPIVTIDEIISFAKESLWLDDSMIEKVNKYRSAYGIQ